MVKYIFFEEQTTYNGVVYEANKRYPITRELLNAYASRELKGAHLRNTGYIPVRAKPKKAKKTEVVEDLKQENF